MRRIWTAKEIDAPPAVVWRLLVETACWPEWGPSVGAVELLAPRLTVGARGRLRTPVGAWVPFEITRYEEGRAWSWTVAGLPATDHLVEPIAGGGCRAGFGVPWVAAPYLAVCRVALGRLDRLARQAR